MQLQRHDWGLHEARPEDGAALGAASCMRQGGQSRHLRRAHEAVGGLHEAASCNSSGAGRALESRELAAAEVAGKAHWTAGGSFFGKRGGPISQVKRRSLGPCMGKMQPRARASEHGWQPIERRRPPEGVTTIYRGRWPAVDSITRRIGAACEMWLGVAERGRCFVGDPA
ncbi:hypothetical protein GOP47_0012067 [Adiantum capillus-veneris]|uniref:Uncharacterized protein n=1 Tax=Adiantum capillus-veneris TaxID=13818 RepID=A0A9D4UUH1_ADICA|nr:hypothetical protein GOP47_0012067 [Adiantum capillus-veneris]